MTREDRRRIRKKIISILAPICLLLILLGLILAHILNEPDYALISIAGIILTAISCVAITLIELILAARAKKKVLKAKIIGYNWVYTNVSTNFLPGIGGYEVHPIAEGYLHNLPIRVESKLFLLADNKKILRGSLFKDENVELVYNENDPLDAKIKFNKSQIKQILLSNYHMLLVFIIIFGFTFISVIALILSYFIRI